jgi:RNA polymerase sigma-70 factor, ECF subfamily
VESEAERLLAHFRRQALRLALRFLSDGHAAEEIVERTSIAAVHKAPRLDSPPSWPWFKEIIRREARCLQREILRRRKRDGRSAQVPQVLTAPPVEGLHAQERLECVLRAMYCVTLDEYEAVRLHFWQDLSVREIAALFRVAPSTMADRLAVAKAKLRKALGPEWDPGGPPKRPGAKRLRKRGPRRPRGRDPP